MYGIPRGKQAKPARGGPVVGPGTGTSDSIKTEVPAGSYIMPADSTAALGMNPDMLKQHKQAGMNAPRLGMGKDKGVPVNLSNGEFELPPEQVHAIGAQALDQAKSATHAPVEPRLGMGKELFFANGGLVDDEEEKRKRNSFDMTNTPTPGNPARAAEMQAQFDQPVTRGEAAQSLPVAPSAAGVPAGLGIKNPLAPTMGDGLAGAAKTLAGGLAYVPSAIYDGARNLAGAVAGGNTDEITQYRGGASSLISEGMGQMSDSAATLRDNAAYNTRSALGISEARPQPSKPASAQGPIPSAAAAELPAQPGVTPPGSPVATPEVAAAQTPTAFDPNAWTNTGNGISARLGVNGAPEFTNEAATPGSVTGAQAMPRLGIGRGSLSNVGNGVGGLSVGQDGDAQLALGRFERANQIRSEMNANRPRELGDNGGKVTVVRDSSRAPTLAERLNDRRDRADAGANLDQRRVANDERRTEAEIARNTANDQSAQQLQGFQISAAQRAEQLQLAYQQARDPQERAALAEQIRVLNGKEQPNRFTVVPGGQEYDTTAAALVNRPARVLNNQSGDFVDGQPAAQQGQAGSAPPAAVKALQESPERAADFDRKYGQGAAARYLAGQ